MYTTMFHDGISNVLIGETQNTFHVMNGTIKVLYSYYFFDTYDTMFMSFDCYLMIL